MRPPSPQRAATMSSKLLLDEQLLCYQPALVRRLGLTEAAIVQQLHYWAQRSTNVHDGHRWVYKTYSDWSDEIGISSKAVRGALDRLRAREIVIAEQSPVNPLDRTLWWRIDHSKLNDEPGSPSDPEGSPSAPEGTSTRTRPKESKEYVHREESPTDSVDSDSPHDLFAYWQHTCRHPTAKPSRDRIAKVKARLAEGYTPNQIRAAIDGAAAQPFVGDTGKTFDDLELICRSGSKLEGFIDRATYTPQRPPTRIHRDKDALRDEVNERRRQAWERSQAARAATDATCTDITSDGDAP